MKAEIEKIIHSYTVTRDTIKRKKYIEGITYDEQPAYRENHDETATEILSLFVKTIEGAEDEIADYIDDAESEGDIQIYIKGNEISKDIINIIKDKIKDKNDYKLTAES